jgi:hypothetical protein
MLQTQFGAEKAAMAFCLKLLECNLVHRGKKSPATSWPCASLQLVEKMRFFCFGASSWPRGISS